MTAPAHPVVFRPIIRLLREAGHEVEVTARDYAQNIALLRRMGMDHTVVGPGHGGASRLGKVRALAGRTRAMRHFASGRRFDLAVAHGSNDLALAAACAAHPRRQHVRLRVRGPAAQHRLPARAARDDARRDPARAARALRRRPGQARPVRGAEGGVLPVGLRAGPGRVRPPRRRPREGGGDRAPAAGGLALPPQVQPAVPARARAARAQRGRLGGGDPAHARPARAPAVGRRCRR